jgi:spermidine synthase
MRRNIDANTWIDDDHGHKRIVIDGITWMEDTPLERRQRQFAIDKCEGSVCVAGLGLALVVKELAAKPEVKSITVVEISQEVVDLVWEKRSKCRIVVSDIEDYLKKTKVKFDYIYLDCYLGGEADLMQKHRKLAEKLVTPDRVLIWQEVEIWQK